jgi:hypothetical protein
MPKAKSNGYSYLKMNERREGQAESLFQSKDEPEG